MATSKTAAERITAKQKRAQALSLRLAGATLESIGNQLGVTPQRVHQYVTQELNRLAAMTQADAGAIRQAELERLDKAQISIWVSVTNGNLQAIDRLIKIIETRSKLTGSFAPQKVAPTDPGGQQPYQPNDGIKESELDARIAELVAQESSRASGDL